MKTAFAITALLCLSLSSLAEPELKGSPGELKNYLLKEEQRTIQFRAKGEVTVAVENPVIALKVKTEDGRFKKALKENRDIRKRITDTLIGRGIARDNIKSAKFSSTPNFGLFGKKPSSYDVQNEIKVTVSTEEQMMLVAGIVDEFDQVYFVGASENKPINDDIKQQALSKAIKSIKSKKSLYEEEMGVKLQLQQLLEIDGPRPPMRPVPMARRSMAVSAEHDMASSSLIVAEEPPPGFGEARYSVTVEARYVLSP